MENQNPQTPQPEEPEPVAQQPNSQNGQPQSLNHSKTIQPSQSFVDEMKSKAPIAQTPPNSQTHPSGNAPPNPIPSASVGSPQNPTPKFNASDIYPTTKSPEQLTNDRDSLQDNTNEFSQLTYDNGREIGGSIFWSQLIAGIVVGVIFWILDAVIFSSHSTIALLIVQLLSLGCSLYIAFYIPYRTLVSRGIKWPGWLAVFGESTLSIISVIIFAVFEIVSIYLLRNVITINRLVRAGNTGFFIFWIGILIAIVVIGYFLTKLAYGLSFKVFGRLNNDSKIKLLTIGMLIFAIFIGLLVPYFALRSVEKHITKTTSPSKTTSPYSTTLIKPPKPDTSPSRYISQTITAHDFKVVLTFDPNAQASIFYQPPRTIEATHTAIPADDHVTITGNQLNSTDKISLTINKMGPRSSLGSIDPTKCKSTADTSTSTVGTTLLFEATIMGQQVPVCGSGNYSNNATIFVEANGLWYFIQYSAGALLPISNTSIIQPIINSIKIE